MGWEDTLKLNELLKKTPLITSTNTKTKSVLIDNVTYTGLELEIEKLRFITTEVLDTIEKWWIVDEDFSLRGDHAYEIRTKSPLYGHELIRAIKTLTSILLTTNGGTLSERCSLHVHLNVLDFSLNQLRIFILLYITIERVLYKYCSSQRDTNGYCLPLYLTEYEIPLISKNFFTPFKTSAESCYNLIRNLPAFGKYAGCNYKSIHVRGSIEFRMHPGTTSSQGFIEWLNILYSIKIAAIKLSSKDNIDNYYDIVQSMSIAGFLSFVFSEKIIETLLYENINKDIQEGLILATEVLHFENSKNILFSLL